MDAGEAGGGGAGEAGVVAVVEWLHGAGHVQCCSRI